MEMIKPNPRGQIVIPVKLRKELDIDSNSTLAMAKSGNAIIIKKVDQEIFNKIKRSLEDIKAGKIKEWKN